MVLDEASPQADAQLDSDRRYSMNDASSSSSESGRPLMVRGIAYNIKNDLVVRPDPITLYFGFFGSTLWRSRLNQALAARFDALSQITQRPATQEEVDAITETTSRGIYLGRTGMPFGIAGVSAYYYNKARQGKLFPLPEAKGAAGATLTPRQLWQALKDFAKVDPVGFRTTAASFTGRYFFLTLGVSLLTNLYAAFDVTTKMLTDPRLEDYRQMMKRTSPEERRRRAIEAVQTRHRQPRHTAEPWSGQRQEQRGQEVLAESHDHDSYGDSGTNTSVATTSYSDPYSPAQSQDQPSSLPDRKNWRTFGGANTVSAETGNDQFDIIDDASPTNPDYDDRSRGQGGSAWDRIRQQNVSNRPQASQQSGVQEHFRGASQGQSDFGRGRVDGGQDRQGQRDFDKLLEADRNVASDPSGTGGQNKGWGSWGR